MRRTRSGGRGFTLIEALVAMFLIGLAVSFAFQVFPRARESCQNHQNHARASLLGQDLLQQARGVSFEDLVSHAGVEEFTGLNQGHAFTQEMDYAVKVFLVDVDQKRVTADIRWFDAGTGRKRQQEFVVETLVFDTGAGSLEIPLPEPAAKPRPRPGRGDGDREKSRKSPGADDDDEKREKSKKSTKDDEPGSRGGR